MKPITVGIDDQGRLLIAIYRWSFDDKFADDAVSVLNTCYDRWIVTLKAVRRLDRSKKASE